jgi:CHAD domain-containing protein
MSAEEEREVERKYDVPLDAVVPDLARLAEIERVEPPVEVEQVATYFDTDDLRLLEAKVTLRRRVGGVDDGWHLKLPGTGDARQEVRLPLGEDEDHPPGELLDRVRVHVRDHEVAARATVTTRRAIHRLLSTDGVRLAELCDDRVRSQLVEAPTDVEEWREWEVELVEAPPSWFDELEAALHGAGADPAASSSKAARALQRKRAGGSWRERLTLPDYPSTGEVLARYLAEHLEALQHQDVMLRAGGSEGVHQLRIAARRVRSALSTYKSVLPDGATDDLRAELKWLGQLLSDARDAQVARERLLALLDEQPVELVMGPVRARIDDDLGAAYREGRSRATQELDGERYFAMLDRLEAFVATPPESDTATQPATEQLPRLLAKDLKRVRKRHRAAEDAPSEEAREVALHEVRKAAKRLRYAGESAMPVFGDGAQKLAKTAKGVTSLLGDVQDTVVARRLLREMGVRAHLSGENGFTFGRLHALEERHQAELLRSYPAAYEELPGKRLDTWLRD